MKSICATILLIASWRSVHGCELATCAGKAFQNCGWTDQNCRKSPTLNLANKGLSGAIPAKFYNLYGKNIGGIPDQGIEKVVTTKVYLQNNQLTGSIGHILGCKTLKEVNLEGNKGLTSTQNILSAATKLENLNIAETSQTDVKWLADKVPNLLILNLAKNNIKDLSPILTMKKLTTLDLTGNPQITDLTALTALTTLKTLTVDPSLAKQRDIIISGGTPDLKRSQLVGVSISDVKGLASGNTDKITRLSASVDTSVAAMRQQNQALETRILALERYLSQINRLCLPKNAVLPQPGDLPGTGTVPNAGGDADIGGRRLSGTGCASVVSSATASGVLSAAAAAAGMMLI